ncbi:hypothetical protein, partial [Klebsiella pneumoniae]|uniref:hypothetical protein n=1 Tax=Klebsiella pneumoniae TaxID=573 RepID=UPI0027303F69
KQLADVCPDLFESTREGIAIRAEAVASDLSELETALASRTYDRACELLLAIGSQALLDGLDFGPLFADWLSARRQQVEQ